MLQDVAKEITMLWMEIFGHFNLVFWILPIINIFIAKRTKWAWALPIFCIFLYLSTIYSEMPRAGGLFERILRAFGSAHGTTMTEIFAGPLLWCIMFTLTGVFLRHTDERIAKEKAAAAKETEEALQSTNNIPPTI